MAFTYPFRMASGTATLVLIDAKENRVLLGIRSAKAWVYPNCESLPGGFMEARRTVPVFKNLRARLHHWLTKVLLPAPIGPEFHEGENLEECAIREAKEELGIDLNMAQLKMFSVWSNSRTDTRAHVINACFYAELTDEQIANIVPGDDLDDIAWFDLNSAKAKSYIFAPRTNQEIEAAIPMAFNHSALMAQGVKSWERDRLADRLIGEYYMNEGKVSNG